MPGVVPRPDRLSICIHAKVRERVPNAHTHIPSLFYCATSRGQCGDRAQRARGHTGGTVGPRRGRGTRDTGGARERPRSAHGALAHGAARTRDRELRRVELEGADWRCRWPVPPVVARPCTVRTKAPAAPRAKAKTRRQTPDGRVGPPVENQPIHSPQAWGCASGSAVCPAAIQRRAFTI